MSAQCGRCDGATSKIQNPISSNDLKCYILNYRYNVVILLLTYIGPITIIAISTIHMSIVLWWRQPVSSINTPQLERAKRKKQKVRKTLKFIKVHFL